MIKKPTKWEWTIINNRDMKARIIGGSIETRKLKWFERLLKKIGVKI